MSLYFNLQRTFEERKRGEARKTWLDMIGYAAKTSGGDLDPVYKATFDALYNDAEAHGHEKVKLYALKKKIIKYNKSGNNW